MVDLKWEGYGDRGRGQHIQFSIKELKRKKMGELTSKVSNGLDYFFAIKALDQIGRCDGPLWLI